MPVQCSTDRLAPAFDGFVAALAGTAVVLTLVPSIAADGDGIAKSSLLRYSLIALPVALLSGISSGIGYRRANRCKELMQEHEDWLLAHPGGIPNKSEAEKKAEHCEAARNFVLMEPGPMAERYWKEVIERDCAKN